MNIIYQSIVKAENDIFDNNIERKNEDAICVKPNCVAVADGAGGIGIFADKWADTLTRNIPENAFCDISELENYIASLWDDFYTGNITLLGNDPWKIKKFENEGSSATLAVLWKTEENKYIYQSYGDTACFVFNTENESLKIQDNLKDINDFSLAPNLINWKDENLLAQAFYNQEITLLDNEEIIIASDGIAVYIYAAYLVYSKNFNYENIKEAKTIKIIDYFKKNPINSFSEWLNLLRDSLKNKENFISLCKEWQANKALPNDDYTIAFITND